MSSASSPRTAGRSPPTSRADPASGSRSGAVFLHSSPGRRGVRRRPGGVASPPRSAVWSATRIVRQAAARRAEPRRSSAAEVIRPRYRWTGGLMADAEDSQPATAAEALERLGRLSLRELSMDSLLQTVAELAKTVLPGTPETSVTLLVNDRPTTVAYTGQLALDLDETQYERDQGPCLHSARTGQLTEIADTRTDLRWRDYARRAAEHG